MIDAAEQEQLRAFSAELAAAEAAGWQPRVVARAFARPRRAGGLVLTMQGWIDLEAACSPILNFELPTGDRAIAQLSEALDAFDAGPVEVDAEEALIIGERMIEAVRQAFSTSLKMVPPEGEQASGADGGFGAWLPVLAFLIVQAQFSRRDALRCPVDQALALIAAHRHNQGWEVAGMTYAQRDASETSQAS